MGGGGDASSILAELFGTCLLVTTLAMGSGTAFAGAAALVALRSALGGTFNPAATIASAVNGDMNVKDALITSAAQVAGGALGAVLAPQIGGGALPAVSTGQTDLALEALFTCMVCLSIVSSSKVGNAVAYGAAFLAASSAVGGAFNPATVLGACIAAKGSGPWIVIGAEVAGGVLAGLLHHVIKGSARISEKVVAEFVAAFFLTATALKAGSGQGGSVVPMAACLAFVVIALGASGNTVIAAARLFSKKTSLGDSAVIVVAQFAGAACAALLLKALGAGGSLSLSTEQTAGLTECVFSALLGMAAIGGATDVLGEGLSVSFAFFAASSAAAHASGGILNPAVAFGACVQDMAFGPLIFPYAPFEIGGGLLAALVMHAIHRSGFGVKAREVAVEEAYHAMM